nr:PREDICTED: uncharacterized protein LOC100883183 [Megachile rotundata]
MSADLEALRREVEAMKKTSTQVWEEPPAATKQPTRRRISSSSVREIIKRRQLSELAEVLDTPGMMTQGTEESCQMELVAAVPQHQHRSSPPMGLETLVSLLKKKVEDLTEEVRGRDKKKPADRGEKETQPKAPSRAASASRKGGNQVEVKKGPANPTPPPPPPAQPSTTEMWSTVVGRKARREAKKAEQPKTKTQATPKSNAPQKRVTALRPPRMAAVTLTVAQGAKVTYAEILLKARQAVDLAQMGIQDIKVRKAITGGIVIGLPGEESRRKATELADKLQRTFTDGQVRVACPVKTGELRLVGLDESITPKDVAEALAKSGECQASDMKVGEIRQIANGMGTLWARYPLTALQKIEAARRVRVGWSSARIEILEARSLRCFRCLHKGHTARKCTEKEDRSGRCYTCGAEVHKAASCTNKLKCPLCSDLGRPYSHKLGAEKEKEQQPPQNEGDTMEVVEDAATTSCTIPFRWGELVVVGVYAPPRWPLAEFEEMLDRVGQVVSRCPTQRVLVLGDFNAKARQWGSPGTDARGEAALDWAAARELLLLNRGSVSTCVRPQGESIVDLTWASPAAARDVASWRVVEEVETLSDHRYIRVDFSSDTPCRRGRRPPPKRWALKRLDKDMLVAAAVAASWPASPARQVADVEGEARWFRDTVQDICSVGMPRATPRPRRGAYWWTPEIASLREACLPKRRQCLRARRRRNRDPAAEQVLWSDYRDAVVAVQTAIRESKDRSWDEFLGSLERDRWGRPYKLVMGKLRPWAPPITESLDPQTLGRVVETLFPWDDSPSTRSGSPAHLQWTDDMGVSEGELVDAVRRASARNTAPGPDGIPGRVWALVLPYLGERLAGLFSACLRESKFPSIWKAGRLVLLKKEGKPEAEPGSYRPVVLLDVVGKIFERVIANRLVAHFSGDGPDVVDCQFGFRRGRSTVDAVQRVRRIAESATSRGGVAIGISLDIVNAFNALPH